MKGTGINAEFVQIFLVKLLAVAAMPNFQLKEPFVFTI